LLVKKSHSNQFLLAEQPLQNKFMIQLGRRFTVKAINMYRANVKRK
jgi:hypothetical protein